MSEMSYEDALSALTEAAAQDVAAEQAQPAPPASPAPAAPVAAPQAPEGAPVEGAQPVEGQAPAQAVEAGGVEQPEDEAVVPFNPDELPPELIPAWKQMQSAFTPRLQQAAAINKRFQELGGEEVVQQAVDLYQRIGDPNNWPSLYEELYNAMQEAGLDYFDDDADAEPAAPAQLGELADDPELAPLVNQLKALQARTDQQQALLDHFNEQQEAQRYAAEQELQQTQHLAALQRQVVGIRQANPHYTDDDIRDIVQMGAFFNDDLELASQAYEASFARRMTRYFEGKSAGAPPAVAPAAGAGLLSNEDKRPETVDEAEAEAIEYMRSLQAQGMFDGDI